MRALVLTDRLHYVTDHPEPEPGEAEALVRVTLAGLCGTDLELLHGYHGFQGVPGHEFVGVVEAGPAEWVGRRVVASINIGCGHCERCRATGPEHCAERRVIGILGRDGVFAERVVVPVANLHAVPDDVADERAVFTEPLAAALRLRQQGLVEDGDRVAVIGPGRLGLLIGQVLALAGAEVTMLGRRPESLGHARQLGLATGLTTEAAEGGFDVVVEASGSPEAIAEAVRLVRPLGRIALKGTFHGTAPVDTSALVVKEVTVVGSRCGAFPPALALLENPALNTADLVEAVYPLADGLAAFHRAAHPGTLKVLLRP